MPDKTWLECEGAEGANILLLGADLERIREGIKPYNIILAIVDYNGDLQYEKQYQQFLKNLTPASSHPGAYKFEHGSLWLSKDGEESLVGCKDSSLFFSQSADGPKISYCYYRDPKKEIRTTKNVWGLGGKVMQCSALNPAAVLSLEIPVLAPRGVTQQLPRTRMHDFVLHIPGVLQYLDEKREELDGLWRIRSFHFKDVSTAAKFRQLKY